MLQLWDSESKRYQHSDNCREYSENMAADASLGSLKIPAPGKFKGAGPPDDSSEYETFSRQLKAYLSLQAPRFQDLMEAAEQSAAPVGLPTDPADQTLARQLQNFLILLCTDKASRVVCRNDSDINGFESWRRLYVRYAPSKRVKYLGHMQTILKFRFSDANLEQDLNDWEAEIEKYERGSGQIVSDDVRVGVLMSNTPSKIQEHLQLNTGLDSTYSEVRGIIMNYCKTRQLVKKKNSHTSSDDMDIGAIWRKLLKGKGKGKGKQPWSNPFSKGKRKHGKGKGKKG